MSEPLNVVAATPIIIAAGTATVAFGVGLLPGRFARATALP